jgi:hypothetical protein
MYIHETIMLCALDLLKEHNLESIDIIGELCQAGFTLAAFSPAGLVNLHNELKTKVKHD